MTSSENSSALNTPLTPLTSSDTPPDNGFDMAQLFSPENILKIVYTKIVSKNRSAPGLDSVSSRAFIASLENEIAVIQRKTANNTFSFTRYHLNLVPKGPNKLPRKICIPTIRDRVVIALISEYLKNIFPKETRRPLANVVVNRVLKHRNSYQRFFKLDIKTFFATIDHELLFRKLRSRIHDESILSLLQEMFNTDSFDPETRKTDDSRKSLHRGIPEGLSCSGLLADIFLSDIDNKYGSIPDIAFFRYVDDILVFTDKESFDSIRKAVTDDIRALNLDINEEKDESGDISDTFQYLGYVFNSQEITVRKSSVLKHEEALENMFRKYAMLLKQPELDPAEKASLEFEFKNKISMLCAGVKVDEKQLGWLSYYRRINDTRLLHRLDWLVGHFQKRFGTELSDVKRHVRAYYELNKNIKSSRYIYSINTRDYSLIQALNRQKINVNIHQSFKKALYEMQDISREAVISYIAGHPGKIPPAFLKELFALPEEDTAAESETNDTEITSETAAETAAEKPEKTANASESKTAPEDSPLSENVPDENQEAAARPVTFTPAASNVSLKILHQDASDDETIPANSTADSSQEPDANPEIAAVYDKLKNGHEISAREYLLLNNKDVAGLLTDLEELAGDDVGRMVEDLARAIVTKELMKDPIIEEDFENTGYY